MKLVTVGPGLAMAMCERVRGSSHTGNSAILAAVVVIGTLGHLSVRFWIRRFISSREPDV
jgi:hypothetical protein